MASQLSRTRVDLNADLGESYGVYTLGHDELLMPIVTSANVACGFHAGDPGIMRRTVRLAREHGVAIGAHPGFPDRLGFGRRRLEATPAEIEDLVLYQVAALAGVVSAEGGRLSHVKPHGALYNMAAADRRLADAVARAVAALDASLILVGLAGSEILEAGRAAGVPVAAEIFADRAYTDDGSLLDRSLPGAVISGRGDVVDRAVRMALDHELTSVSGARRPVTADTICLHGDTEGAVDLARGIRAGLEASGADIRALRDSWTGQWTV